MNIDASSAKQTALDASGSSNSVMDQSQIFDAMVQGILKTGMTLVNTITGDIIDSINSSDDDS